jgi:thermitase
MMKRFNWFFLIIALSIITITVIVSCTSGLITGQSEDGPQQPQPNMGPGISGPYAEREAVVRLKADTDPETVALLVDGEIIQQFRIDSMEYLTIRIPESETMERAVEILENADGTDYAEPNYLYQTALTPNDPSFSSRQYYHQRINSPEAWEVTTGSESVIIAILDTGVDGTHPEFSGRMLAGYDYVSNIALTGEENSDQNGHGTHVAGIAAATGNDNIGIAGLDWNARIMPVRVLNAQGTGTVTGIANGIGFAVNNGADVINLSFSGKLYSNTMRDAIVYAREAGVIVVAAMGNNYSIRYNTYPAGYRGVIAVGSTDARDQFSKFSTYGEWMSVSAPGSEIYSTFPNAEYKTASGTSMATPLVAGLAALVLAKNPDWTPSQVRSQIEATADDLGESGFDPYYGYGRINAGRALGEAVDDNYGIVDLTTKWAGGGAISGWDVILKDTDGNTVATGKSNTLGKTVFFDMPAGSYKLEFINSETSFDFNVNAGLKTVLILEVS